MWGGEKKSFVAKEEKQKKQFKELIGVWRTDDVPTDCSGSEHRTPQSLATAVFVYSALTCPPPPMFTLDQQADEVMVILVL